MRQLKIYIGNLDGEHDMRKLLILIVNTTDAYLSLDGENVV